jgi:subtilisin family serine protease
VRFVLCFAVTAAGLDAVAQTRTTRCREAEVVLDAHHSAALLEGCEGGDSLLWHLDRIDQVESRLDGQYDLRGSGAGSVIYVMDTGIMASHSEFRGESGTRVIAGHDATHSLTLGASSCSSADKSIAPCYASFDELTSASHGTAVASVAAGNNVGVAPDANVVSVRVMNERGLATTRTYLDGLNAIIAHAWLPDAPQFETGVVNISGWVLEKLTSASSSSGVISYATVEQKIREMIDGVDAAGRPDPNGKRFLFVVAANNTDGGCGPDGAIDRFPATLGADIDGVITVGGMTPSNTVWNGTCRDGVEVLAPAQSIFSASITADNHYRGRKPHLRSGTSFATPIIAGIAARLLSDRPDLTPQQLEWWITSTPSRVFDGERSFADGKVAFVQSIAPAPAESVTAEREWGSGPGVARAFASPR